MHAACAWSRFVGTIRGPRAEFTLASHSWEFSITVALERSLLVTAVVPQN